LSGKEIFGNVIFMAGIGSPQSQAGIINFYDAQTNGPKLNPKVVVIVVAIFTVIIIIASHVIIG